jgi:hypothetical protein
MPQHRDDVVRLHAPLLRSVLALEIDDEIAGRDVGDAGADGADPTDALDARRGGQRRLQTVRTPSERDVGRVDREREHVEDDFAGSRRVDVGNVSTARATSSGAP